MNKNIKKDKYQLLPNFYDLLNTLAETITSKNGEKVWFASVDLKNAFGQVKVNPELAKHCNFAIIGGGRLGSSAAYIVLNQDFWAHSNVHRISANNGRHFNKHHERFCFYRRHFKSNQGN